MKTSQYRIDLIRQMADCDANFIRLLKLMPELESFRERSFQLDQACPDGVYEREFVLSTPHSDDEERVRISVLEVFRYTTTLSITQLTQVSDWIDPPSIIVRVYHDASTAEALSYQGHKALLAKYAIPNPTMYHQDEKRQINEFLGEWLNLCLQAGRALKAPTIICAA